LTNLLVQLLIFSFKGKEMTFHVRNVIEAEGLTKKFGPLTAVSDFSLAIQAEEIFGLLGPNGAGKTTAINMLTTILKPTSGTARIAGYDIKRDAKKVRECVGIVFQDPTLDTVLTGWENLELHARLYGLRRADYGKRIEELLSLVDLEARAHDLVRTYSGGMRRRLELVRGLLHHPSVLFLDEPTLGLDPQTRARTWEYIRLMVKKEGTTVLLTTHYLDEAQQMCDRIAIMDEGKIIALGTPGRLIDSLGGCVLYIEAPALPEEKLRLLPFIKECRPAKGGWEIVIAETYQNLPRLLETIGPISHLDIRRPTLNDVFLKLTGRHIREESGEDKGSWMESALRFQQRGRR